MSREKPSGNRKTGSSRPFKSESGDKPAPGGRKRIVRTKDADASKSFSADRSDRTKRPYGTRPDSASGDKDRTKRPYGTRPDSGAGGKNNTSRPYGTRPGGRPTDTDRPTRSFDKKEGSDRPKRSFEKRKDSDRPTRSFDKKEGSDRPKRSFEKREDSDRPKRSFDKREDSDRPKRSFDKRDDSDRPKRSFDKRAESDRPKRSFDKRDDSDRPKRSFEKREDSDRPKRSFEKRADSDRPKRSFDKRDDSDRPKRSYDKREDSDRPRGAYDRKSGARSTDTDRPKHKRGDSPDKFFAKGKSKYEKPERIPRDVASKPYADSDRTKRSYDKPERRKGPSAETNDSDDSNKEATMPLNKYVAHCGICGRREAVDIVKEGKVKVNGEVMLQPGYKVQSGDKVEYEGKVITSQKNLVYILLNKPKNYITTTDDPQERKTVMELIADAGDERVYPVGRLDRNTSGLLLMTNDGALAEKLSHPKYNIKKLYQVTLDKNLSQPDFNKIMEGFTLEDGEVRVDAMAYLENKNEVGLEIHSGRNRIVRRIFEHLGYVVEKLDRVMYAGLTKKNIPRGKWRFLNEQEVINLKYFKQ